MGTLRCVQGWLRVFRVTETGSVPVGVPGPVVSWRVQLTDTGVGIVFDTPGPWWCPGLVGGGFLLAVVNEVGAPLAFFPLPVLAVDDQVGVRNR